MGYVVCGDVISWAVTVFIQKGADFIHLCWNKSSITANLNLRQFIMRCFRLLQLKVVTLNISFSVLLTDYKDRQL